MENKRGQWGSNLGFLLAAVGSAVGLGNIWGFPYKMGANGGFPFLLVYILLAVFVGFIIMLGELTLGRKTGKGAVGTYVALSKKFKWVGWLGVLSAFFIMSFYSVLGGYCIKYMVGNFSDLVGGGFGAVAAGGGGAFFENMLMNPVEGILYTVIFMIITCIIVMGGIRGGIEKFSKIAMPALFVMLLVVIVRSVTLPGAEEGLKFMFNWNIEPLKENFVGVLASAGGQMFFSLSLGMGCMITYGSYLAKKEKLETNAVIIPVADTLIALLAGIAVIPAAFALGGEGAAMRGPGLLFITLQNVFDSMGAIGAVFGIIFYLLVIVAAVTSAISLVEVIVTYFSDSADSKGKEINRKKITIWVSVVITALAAIVAADGLGSTGMWAPIPGLVWLEFMDLWSEGIMMPLGALFMAWFIAYSVGMKSFSEEIELQGNKFSSKKFFSFCVKFIVPPVMVFILYGQLCDFFPVLPAADITLVGIFTAVYIIAAAVIEGAINKKRLANV